MRWVKLTFPPEVRARCWFRIERFTSRSLAGTERTLVAVGTDSDASMFCAMRAAAPRRGEAVGGTEAVVAAPSVPAALGAGTGSPVGAGPGAVPVTGGVGVCVGVGVGVGVARGVCGAVAPFGPGSAAGAGAGATEGTAAVATPPGT